MGHMTLEDDKSRPRIEQGVTKKTTTGKRNAQQRGKPGDFDRSG